MAEAEKELSKLYVIPKTLSVAAVQDLIAGLISIVESADLLAGYSPVIAAAATARLAGDILGKPILTLPSLRKKLDIHPNAVKSAVHKLQTKYVAFRAVFERLGVASDKVRWLEKTQASEPRVRLELGQSALQTSKVLCAAEMVPEDISAAIADRETDSDGADEGGVSVDPSKSRKLSRDQSPSGQASFDTVSPGFRSNTSRRRSSRQRSSAPSSGQLQ